MTTIALIAVCFGYVIGPMGMAAVNVAIPTMASDLDASASQVGWIPTIYLLSNVAFMLPCGKWADNFGRKRVYAYGLGLNAFAALMCAIGTSIEWVLVWRFIQGAAGAMIFGTGVAIITSVTPDHKRGAALGITAACVYVGLTVAPAIGGWLTENWGWRSVFYFQVPLIIALLGFMHFFLRGEWKNDRFSAFDWWGSAIFAVFSVTLVYGLSRLPDGEGVAILALSGASLVGFVQHQRHHRSPLIRMQMFKESRVFSLSLTTSFFMYASNFAIIFLMSLYLQFIQGSSPAHTGQILLLQALSMAIVAPFAGKLADRFEPRVIATTGCVIVGAGFALLNGISPSTSTAYISGSLLLIGIGFGLFSTPNNNAIMGAASRDEVGVASASMNLSRTIGNLFGMSLVNLMMHHYLGDASLTSAKNAELMTTISLAFTMSLVFVMVACVTSAIRGRQ
ncbi:MFS transporter [Alteromonas oceanisediminis]|uniref:MFS transporter n=1 Tax=Alteromonas oceanisediminis TaxID=2836180 RepID=UPI0036F36053